MTHNLQWFESDAFWLALEKKVYMPATEDVAAPEAAAAAKLLNLQIGQSVLDLCCGNGRHSVALAELGFIVSGVDLSSRYLELARARPTTPNSAPTFLQADIRSFVADTPADGAMILWNAFGYFESDEDDLLALRNIFQSLRPGGRLLIQTHGKESTARKFVRRDWFEMEGQIVLDERWIEENWSRMRTRYVILDGSGRHEHVMSCRLYSPTDLAGLLTAAGFSDSLRFYGSLAGTPYDERAFELVALATKPQL